MPEHYLERSILAMQPKGQRALRKRSACYACSQFDPVTFKGLAERFAYFNLYTSVHAYCKPLKLL